MDRLNKWKTTLYCTDNWEAYSLEIPPELHLISKSETLAIERNNCLNRHWLGRFKRKSIVVSKSVEMVDLTMGLFARYRVNGDIQELISLLG